MYTAEIAKELDVSKGSVNLWLSEYKKSHPDLDKKTNQRKELEKQEKYNKPQNVKEVLSMRQQGFTLKEIASNLDTSSHFVTEALKVAGVNQEEEEKIRKTVVKRQRLRREKGELAPSGGYREKSGRSKTGYYKGIYCGSTYELCWAIHALDHDIQFTRFGGSLAKNGVRYYPDFLLADGVTIVELKGYEKEESVAKKTAVAVALGYKVRVLRAEDLGFAFDYVKEKYGFDQKNSYQLYDGYKPKYKLTCSFCGTIFMREKIYKKDEKNVFCSRSCSLKNNREIYQEKLKSDPELTRAHSIKCQKNNSRAKLTPKQIKEIFQSKDTYEKIAKDYGVHRSMVYFIKAKKVHKHILEDL